MTGSADAPTLRDVFRGRRGGFLATLLLAEFGAAMQGIAYSTVLPLVARDLDGFALFGATLAAGSIAAVLMLSFAAPLLARVRPGVVLLVATVLYVAGAALAVFAPAMIWVLVGTVVRGIAAGLIGGFGMGAIGALYDERERPRVFGLFALIWLLPSIVGPPLNAVVTEWIGWRWALAWPAVLVVAARVLMGGYVSAIPWERTRVPVRAGAGVAVAAFLALSAAGSAMPNAVGAVAFGAGILGGGIAIVVFLRRGDPPSSRVLLAFALLCAAYFGIYEVLALTVVEGLGSSVLWAAVAISGGLVAWSIAGLRPRPHGRPDPAVVGPVLVVVAIALLAGAVAVGGLAGLCTVVVASVVLGTGMGSAYPLLSSEPFDRGSAASTVGALIAFAETAGTAWAVLLAGGLYSALHGAGWAPAASLGLVFGAVGIVGVGAVVAAVLRRRQSATRMPSDAARS